MVAHGASPSTDLEKLAQSLREWRRRTGDSSGQLPSDSRLRGCEVARELGIHGKISRAGGFRVVQQMLGLAPMLSRTQTSKDRELLALAEAIRALCERERLPDPCVQFPEKRVIRRLEPTLGNRIEAFPGRSGYSRLAAHMQGRDLGDVRTRSVSHHTYGLWTDPWLTRELLAPYLSHPNVLPRLCTLPRETAAAIQRHGGAAEFVNKVGMIKHKDWSNVLRFARLVRWLADCARTAEIAEGEDFSKNPDAYVSMVETESMSGVEFPPASTIESAGYSRDCQRYGGRKSLSIRLGFLYVNSRMPLFMGPMSVRFAADLLEYAAQAVCVSEDCSVGMPPLERLIEDGRLDLVAAIGIFGGEVDVGRRLGLVPYNFGRRGGRRMGL